MTNIGSSPDPLLNPSLTTGGLGPKSGEATTAAPQAPAPAGKSGAAAADVELLERDAFVALDIPVQVFSTRQGPRTEYRTDLNHPILDQPEYETSDLPRPFDTANQRATRTFWMDQAHRVIAEKIKENGGAPIALVQQAIQEGGIPAPVLPPKGQGQKPVSEKESGKKDSTPLLATPAQAAIAGQVSLLLQTIVSGKSSSLTKDGQEVVSQANKETQKAWNLPGSWTVGTQKAQDWTPVQALTVPPVNVDIARSQILGENVEQLCLSLQTIGNKTIQDPSMGEMQKVAVREMLQTILMAIRDLKEVIQKISLKESEVSEKTAQAKMEELGDRMKFLDESLKKVEEAAEARRKQEKMSKIMKIVAPIVSAIIIVIGVIALPFTAGGSTALIAAGLIVASVMLTYTVLDSQFDLTSKAIAGFNSLVEKIAGGREWAKNLIKVIALVIVAIIVIALFVGSGGTAAGSIGASIATQVAKEVGKQLIIQASIMFIMSSNILPELAVKALIACKAFGKDDEKSAMIAQMVIMALQMVCIMVGMAKGSGASGAKSIGTSLKEGINGVKEAITSVKTAIENIKTSLKNIKEAIDSMEKLLAQLEKLAARLLNPETLKAALDNFKTHLTELKSLVETGASKEAIKQAAENVKKALEEVQKALADAIAQAAKQAGERLKETIKSTTKELMKIDLDSLKGTAEALKDSAKAVGQGAVGAIPRPNPTLWIDGFKEFAKNESLPKIAKNIQDILKMAQLGAEAGMGIYVGTIGVQLSNILKEQGRLDEAAEVAQTLIKLFTQLAKEIQESISSEGEWVSSLSHAADQVMAASDKTLASASSHRY